MQYKSTLFKASVIATMALATASLSAQKVTRSELMKKVTTTKVSLSQQKTNEARRMAAAPLLKYSKNLKAATKAVTPFASALEHVSAKNQATKQPVIFHAPMANPNASLVGYVNYSDVYASGMYSIQLPAGDFELLNEDLYSTPSNGCYVEDGVYYGLQAFSFFGYYFFYPVAYDMNDWSDISPDASLDAMGYEWYATALTNDPVTGQGFGCFYNEDGSDLELCRVDVMAGTRTVVALADLYYVAMATGADGYVYALGDDSNLYKIDAASGEAALIGATGFNVADAEGAYGQSMAIDTKTGACYWAAIDASGEESCMMSVDLGTGAATKVLDYGLQQIYGLYAVAPAAEDDAPAAVVDLAAEFVDASLTGTVTFTAPTVSFAENALEGDLTYTIVCGGQNFTGLVAPGAAVSQEITVEEGTQLIVVTTANAAGTSPKAKISLFVGQDTPVAPANVSFAYDKEAQMATIAWDAVTAGVNNGFLGAVTYNVYDPAGVAVAEGISETTCTVAFAPEGLGNYVFAVEAVAGGKVSAKTNTNGVVIGDAMSVPATLDYTQEYAIALSTVIDANEDGKTWTYSSMGSTRYPYNSYSAADDWLITPAVTLKAGRTYVLSYTAWPQGTTFPEILEITVGKGATIEAQTQVLREADYVTSTIDDVNEIEFSVAEDGEYNIGFHALSEPDMFYLNLGLVTIEAGPMPEAPAAAELAINAADGALNYDLVITLPTKNIAGNDLGAISKILVYGPNGEVALEEGYTAGQTVVFSDEVETSGTYEWSVVCYNEAENGLKAKVSAFLGQDVPNNVLDAELTDLITAVRIDWSPVTTGLNGGYIDPSQVSYEIYSVVDGYIGELLVQTAETTATVDYDTQVGEPDLLQFAMRTVGAGGTSSYYGTGALVVGEADVLPWAEPFANGGIEKFIWTSRTSADMNIGLSTSEGDGGCVVFSAPVAGASGSVATAKIALGSALNPEVIFDYQGAGASFDVVIETQDKQKEVIATFGGSSSWLTGAAVIPAKYLSEPYVIVYFTATINEPNAMAYIDNLNVRDVLEYNLSIQLAAPESIVKGEAIRVVATVTNEGAHAVQNPEVKFTVNGQVVPSTSNVTLQPFQSVEFPLDITTRIFTEADAIELEAEAVYALDLKPEDNVATAVVELKTPSVAPVENLAGELSGEGLLLTWNAPSSSAAEQTEDFEDWAELAHPYTAKEGDVIPSNWNQTDSYNGWTMYDLDGGMTYGWEGVAFPFANDAFGYAVFNYATLGVTNDAHSGDQILMAFSNVSGTNDDWLISPELPGMAQTVSFWYNELTDQYGNEKFEVLYSTTDTKVESFTKVDTYYAAAEWQKLEVELPEGTKYFAIRYVSTDVFGFMLDDVTYTAGAAAPVSFNVYCDAKLVGNTAEESFFVPEVAGNVYSVSAVYANGAESAPVSINVADIVGIQEVVVNKAKAPMYNLMGVRVNEPKAGIYVSAGKKMAM